MLTRILPFTIILAGCGTNPCDVGLLFANMTPEQQANCAECSNAYDCPDDDGETGEEPPGVQVSVAADDPRYAFDGVLSQPVKDVMATPGGLTEIGRGFDACNANDVHDYRCNLGWDGQPAIAALVGTENTCLACRGQGGIDYIPFDTTSAWPACPSGHGAALIGAWTHDGEPTCTPNAPSAVTSCDKGHVQIWEEGDPWTHFPANNWTCRCPDGVDSQCQPGAVCEAAWIGGGLFAKPTLCTWDDGAGDANGAAPEGPSVYGLGQWSDGIVIDGDMITIDPTLLVDLWPYEGQPFPLFNDDQRVDERGTITHCGAASLCEHVGLAVGDRLVLDGFDVNVLVNGGVALLEVERPRAASRWLTITVDGV